MSLWKVYKHRHPGRNIQNVREWALSAQKCVLTWGGLKMPYVTVNNSETPEEQILGHPVGLFVIRYRFILKG
jgi:hypothetical protein